MYEMNVLPRECDSYVWKPRVMYECCENMNVLPRNVRLYHVLRIKSWRFSSCKTAKIITYEHCFDKNREFNFQGRYPENAISSHFYSWKWLKIMENCIFSRVCVRLIFSTKGLLNRPSLWGEQEIIFAHTGPVMQKQRWTLKTDLLCGPRRLQKSL